MSRAEERKKNEEVCIRGAYKCGDRRLCRQNKNLGPRKPEKRLEWLILSSRKKSKEWEEEIEEKGTRRARRVHWRLPGEGSWIKVEGTTAFLRHLASNICLYGWCVCNTNTCVSSETGNKTGFGLELWMFERVKSK